MSHLPRNQLLFAGHRSDEQDTMLDTEHTKTNEAEFLSVKNLQRNWPHKQRIIMKYGKYWNGSLIIWQKNTHDKVFIFA